MENKKRLIDANVVYEMGHRTPFHIGIADLCDLKELLEDVPTVDAVEVVRCKDCRYYTEQKKRCDHPCLDWDVECYDHWLEMEPNDFCSYGERRKGITMESNVTFTPGQTVYVVERDECGYATDVSGYMLLAQCDYVSIVTPFINDMTELEETLEYLVTETADNYDCDLCVFPSEDCFATEEEARKVYDDEKEG